MAHNVGNLSEDEILGLKIMRIVGICMLFGGIGIAMMGPVFAGLSEPSEMLTPFLICFILGLGLAIVGAPIAQKARIKLYENLPPSLRVPKAGTVKEVYGTSKVGTTVSTTTIRVKCGKCGEFTDQKAGSCMKCGEKLPQFNRG